MKILKLISLAFIISILISINSYSQVQFEASVTSQRYNNADPEYGKCVYFDIYLKQNGGSGPLYLAFADFKLNFDAANFINPTVKFVQGSSRLYNSLGSQTSDYDASIAAEFSTPNEIYISISPPEFSKQSEFDSKAAKIDGSSEKHKLGTFVVYTMVNISEIIGLKWKTGTGGTVVTTFEPKSPWVASPAKGNFIVSD
jgi:hypothetical protein